MMMAMEDIHLTLAGSDVPDRAKDSATNTPPT